KSWCGDPLRLLSLISLLCRWQFRGLQIQRVSGQDRGENAIALLMVPCCRGLLIPRKNANVCHENNFRQGPVRPVEEPPPRCPGLPGSCAGLCPVESHRTQADLVCLETLLRLDHLRRLSNAARYLVVPLKQPLAQSPQDCLRLPRSVHH